MIFNKKNKPQDYLIRIEAINFDHTIEDTNQLSVRRGGSMALHNALVTIKDTLSLESIRCGGGIGIFKKNTDDIKQLLEDINNHLLQEDSTITFLPSLPFTVQHIKLESEKNAQQQALKKLEAQSHLQQLQMPSFQFANCFTHNANNEPCELDGCLPQASINNTSKTKSFSDFSAKRFYYGRDKKQNFIVELLENNPDYKSVKFVNEFESLTDEVTAGDKRIKKLKNKLAILYFDGNHFGRYQKDKSLEEIEGFEATLQTARKAFIQALLEVLNKDDYKYLDQEKAEKQIRMELLLWGGDEIMLAVPAWAGFTTLHLFYQTMQEKLPDDLTHAGGLVFCSHKTPIKRMMNLARELAEEAKNINRNNDLYFTLLLESEDYPTQSILKHWEQHYGRLGKALLPQMPFASGQPDYQEYTDPSTSRSALYKTIHDLYYLCQPNNCQPDEVKKQIETIIEKSGNGKLDAETLANYFSLFKVTTLNNDRDHPDKERLQSLLTNSPDLLKVQPWVYLIEYGDYLINLAQEQTGDEGENV